MNDIQSTKKKNVLFIAVDDLRPQLACYGTEYVLSPNIDGLAASGTFFSHAYCQQAVCAPSRASVLSGCRPDTTGIYDLNTPLRSVMPDVLTLPQLFKSNGYETVSVGKIYHHRTDDLKSWTRPPYFATGDWLGRGYLTDEAMELAAKDPQRGLGPAYECADVPDNAYPDGKNTDYAIAELERLSKQDKPFFEAVGYLKPHLPFNAPKRYWDMYQPSDLPLASNPFPPKGATAYSLQDFGELRQYFTIPNEGALDDALALKLIHGYCACVTYMDAQVGRLLNALSRLQLADDTIVILWGDHGWKLGEHGSWCKHSNFEIDTRAPLILRVPGMDTRKEVSELVEFVDIYPTLAELCDLPLPQHLDGSSMLPLLTQQGAKHIQYAFSQFPRHAVMGYAVRSAQFRYVEWRDFKTGALKARELYDSEHMENENIVEDLTYAEVVDTLSKALQTGVFKMAK